MLRQAVGLHRWGNGKLFRATFPNQGRLETSISSRVETQLKLYGAE